MRLLKCIIGVREQVQPLRVKHVMAASALGNDPSHLLTVCMRKSEGVVTSRASSPCNNAFLVHPILLMQP
jgi:hypothetical protein